MKTPTVRGATVRFALAYAALAGSFGVFTPYFQKLLSLQGFDEQHIGFVFGVFETFGILGQPLWGWRSDRARRRRRILAVAALGTMACFLSFGWIENFLVALAVGGAFGFFFRAITPLLDGMVFRYLSEHGGDFGRTRLSASFAFITSILILEAAGVAGEGARALILTMACVMLLLSAASAGLLPLTDREKVERAGGAPPRRVMDFALFRRRPFVALTVASFFFNFSLVSHYNFFTLFVQKEFDFPAAGYIWVIGTASEIPVVYFSSAIIARIGMRGLFAVGSVATAIRLAGYAAAPSVEWLMGLQLLHAFAYGAVYLASVHYINRLAPIDMKQSAMAVFIALSIGGGGLAGSSIGGTLIRCFGFRTLFGCYAAAAALSLVVLALFVPKLPPAEGRGVSRGA